MGLKSTNDVFCAKSDRVIVDVPSTQKIVDDILICASNLAELFSRMRMVLTNCRKHHISISIKKLSFGPQIDFAGYTLDQNGVIPDKSKVRALTEFPSPKNITELRSFLGLANQLGGFLDKLTSVTDPLRSLLKKRYSFQVDSGH